VTAPVPVEPHPCHCHHGGTARQRHPYLIVGGAFVAGEALSGRRHPLVRFVFTFVGLLVVALVALVVFVVVHVWPLVLVAVGVWLVVHFLRRRTHDRA